MKGLVFGVFLLTAAFGCAHGGQAFFIPLDSASRTSQVFTSDYDKVWDAALTAIEGYPVKTIEKDSGLIITERVSGLSPDYKIHVATSFAEVKELSAKHPVHFNASKKIEGLHPSSIFSLNIMVQKVEKGTRVRIISIEEIHVPASAYREPYIVRSFTYIDGASVHKIYPPAGKQEEKIQSISRGNREHRLLKKIGSILGEEAP